MNRAEQNGRKHSNNFKKPLHIAINASGVAHKREINIENNILIKNLIAQERSQSQDKVLH
jgi:hypothetical protein